MSIYYPPSAENTTYAYFLPDGSVLSGTYYGDVYIAGDATMSANVVIKGNLTIEGTLSGPSHDLTVTGNVNGRYPGYTPTINLSGAAGQNAGNLSVSGQIFNTALTLTGGASAVASAGHGGDVTCAGYYALDVLFSIDIPVDLSGGDCSSTSKSHSAGKGGNFTSYGDVGVSMFSANGGTRSGTLTGTGTGTPPDAGSLIVGGAFTSTMFVSLIGGSITSVPSDSDAGAGGVFIVGADATVAMVNVGGGDVTDETSTHAAGSASQGDAYFGANVSVGSQFNGKGGINSGSGNGGTGLQLYAQSNFIGYGAVIDVSGGAAPGTGNGGNAGSPTIGGSSTYGGFVARGGGSAHATGGNGGNVTFGTIYVGPAPEVTGGTGTPNGSDGSVTGHHIT